MRGERVRGAGDAVPAHAESHSAHCCRGLWNKLFLLRQAPLCPVTCYWEAQCPGLGRLCRTLVVRDPVRPDSPRPTELLVCRGHSTPSSQPLLEGPSPSVPPALGAPGPAVSRSTRQLQWRCSPTLVSPEHPPRRSPFCWRHLPGSWASCISSSLAGRGALGWRLSLEQEAARLRARP